MPTVEEVSSGGLVSDTASWADRREQPRPDQTPKSRRSGRLWLVGLVVAIALVGWALSGVLRQSSSSSVGVDEPGEVVLSADCDALLGYVAEVSDLAISWLETVGQSGKDLNAMPDGRLDMTVAMPRLEAALEEGERAQMQLWGISPPPDLVQVQMTLETAFDSGVGGQRMVIDAVWDLDEASLGEGRREVLKAAGLVEKARAQSRIPAVLECVAEAEAVTESSSRNQLETVQKEVESLRASIDWVRTELTVPSEVSAPPIDSEPNPTPAPPEPAARTDTIQYVPWFYDEGAWRVDEGPFLSFAWNQDAAPPWPASVPGYALLGATETDAFLWNTVRDKVRVFGESVSILNWDYPMTGCWQHVWLVRWRTLDQDGLISAAPIYRFGYTFGDGPLEMNVLNSEMELALGDPNLRPSPGRSGIVGSHWCGEPAFVSALEDANRLQDVVFEVRFYQAVP